MNSERAKIDDILEQVHSQAAPTRDAIDEDVNSILESLGMPARPVKPSVLAPTKAQQPAPQQQQVQQQTPPAPTAQGKQNAQNMQPAASAAHNTPPAPLPAPPKRTTGARIVTMAPLTAPMLQNETETLELPTIKAYSAMQSRRIAEIERVAVETALARAAENQRHSPYNLPGSKPRGDMLSVEVDDRFRAFFGKTVSDDGISPRVEDTVELETQRGKRKGGRGKRARAKTAKLDQLDAYATSELGYVPQSDAMQTPLQDMPALQEEVDGLPPLMEMTGNLDVLGAAFAARDAQKGAAPADNAFAEQYSAAPAAPPMAVASDFTVSIAPPTQSDTFMLNHIDDRAQEQYVDDAAAGELFADAGGFAPDGSDYAAGGNYPADGNYAPIDFDTRTNIDFAAPGRSAPPRRGAVPKGGFSAKNGFFDDAPSQSGSTYREITVTMPLGKTTSTIGIDPDKYGVPNADYDAYEDYNHLSDGPSILRALRTMRVTRVFRICVTGLITLFLAYLGFTARGTLLPAIAMLDAHAKPMAFLIANLALLCVVALVCMTTIGAGLAGLFGRPSADSLATLATIGAIVQTVAYVLSPTNYHTETVTLFAPVATLLLCVNTVGKWLHAKAVSDNFDLASAGEEHAAAFLVPNHELTKMVCAGLGEHAPLLLVSRPTELVRGFMRQSFSSHLSDVYGRKLSLILFMGSLLCGVITGLRSNSSLTGISAAVAALCLGAPLAATLAYAVPARLLQRASGAVGAVVPGPSAVQNLGLCNTVLLQSNDLFPATCVRLHGIKPFAKQRIDHAILYAASLVYENCETLRDTFMTLIDGKKSMLYKVEDPQQESGYGYGGRMEGHAVLFGNRAMMRRHNVEIPSTDYERKFTKNGERSVMYLAVDGHAFSLYIISYLPDPAAQDALDSLAESGVCVLVQSDDFNLTAQLVASTYRVSPALVKVLSQPERELLAGQTDYLPESEGYMTHRGTCASFIGGLRAAATAARSEHLADTIEMSAVLFSILVSIVLSAFMALSELSLSVVLLYQLAWCAITVLFTLFKK